eukprot:gene5484-9302_t
MGQYFVAESSEQKSEPDLFVAKTNYLKCIFLGDYNVGKTTVKTNNLTISDNQLPTMYYPTISPDFLQIDFFFDEMQYKIEFWDTQGSERFRSISKYYYRNVNFCFLVFDLNNIQSFKSIYFWRDELLENLEGENCKLVLIGNKNDLEIVVPDDEIDEFLERTSNCDYLEICMKQRENNQDLLVKTMNFVIKDLKNYSTKYRKKVTKGKFLDLNFNFIK